MNTTHVNGVDIEYEQVGHGEPMLLIHGSNLADGLRPLTTALSRRAASLSFIRYHRRGLGGSAGGRRPVSTEEQAADALGLLDALDLPSAHILGYSYGATVALEAALSAPQRVRSLVLLEPILTEVPSWAEFSRGMEPVMKLYQAGDMEGAVTATFAALGGPTWPDLIRSVGTEALAMAIRDTETYYRVEAPALHRWTLDPQRAAALRAPVLSVRGMNSGQFFAEGRQLLHRHFPDCADADIPDASHLLFLQQPEAIATAVVSFIDRNRESG
ncbi:alpha/beta fold hydrolase [Kribbella pratensis]|uniref:Pimeloyl-ACP methyl ester carboxylesterase n=1 Tax=Kribbella pratensis TaxID=2512112 RepID=A0A4R8CP19_9ACTN|nr:alpha/beta hydrolase [Kribbella pratensis]TDW77863.1 pimeloyl-ACP methyl ester carboxylesterase [Kribbella pratensis]